MSSLHVSGFCLTLLLVAFPVEAQDGAPPSATAAPQRAANRPPSGVVTGVVTAPDAARLPGTAVALLNLETGWSLVVVSATDGAYLSTDVPPGTYDLSAKLEGFRTEIVPRVAVRAGETTRVDVRLALNSVTETVTVVGALVKDSIEAGGIRESAARDIGEALSEMNGVAMVRKGGIANDVVVQGYQSRNLTVLIDGDRLHGACPNGMDPVLFHADFAEVDHLEVAKGPFDVRYQGSLGGVINVVTRNPGRGLHASVDFSAGSAGYFNPSAGLSAGNSKVSGLGGYSYRTSEPYRDGAGALLTQPANYRPDAVGSRAYAVQTGWARVFVAPWQNHSLQISYARQDADRVLYPYLLMDGLTDDAERVSARYGIVRDGRLMSAVSARAYATSVTHWMTDEFRTSSAGMPRSYSMGTQADTRTAGGGVEVELRGATAGVELFRRQWSSTTMMAGSKYAPQYSIPFVSVDSIGAFLDYRRPLSGRMSLEAGGRIDHSRSGADAGKANTDLYFAYTGTRAVSASDTGFSGKVRFVAELGRGVQVFGGVGRTVRAPDPQERYFALKRMGSDWVGNPLLVATANTGVSGGATYHSRRLTASISASYDRLSDFVVLHPQSRVNSVPGIMNTSARSYANTDARMANAEFDLTYKFDERLSARVTGAYTRGRQEARPADGIASGNLAEIPPARASALLRYDRPVMFVEAQGVFAGSQSHLNTDVGETSTPAYGLLNLRAGAKVGGIRLTVALHNVFSRLYMDYNSYQRDPFRSGARIYEPGRQLYANVSYRF